MLSEHVHAGCARACVCTFLEEGHGVMHSHMDCTFVINDCTNICDLLQVICTSAEIIDVFSDIHLIAKQDADVYLLDDVLAAVDSHVAASLVNNVICGPVLGGKTRVVVTHSPACKARADMLIRMYGGKIDYFGPPEGDPLNIVDVSTFPPVRIRTVSPGSFVHQKVRRHSVLLRIC